MANKWLWPLFSLGFASPCVVARQTSFVNSSLVSKKEALGGGALSSQFCQERHVGGGGGRAKCGFRRSATCQPHDRPCRARKAHPFPIRPSPTQRVYLPSPSSAALPSELESKTFISFRFLRSNTFWFVGLVLKKKERKCG